MIDYIDIPLFNGLSKVDIARLVPELDAVELVPGQVLFHAGDPGDALYIVRDGKLAVLVQGADGETVLNELGAGAAVGEVALFTGEPRMATIRAVEESHLWRLDRDRFETLMVRHPHLAVHMNRLLGQRLVTNSRHLSEVKDRLASLNDTIWQRLGPRAEELLIKAAPVPALTTDLAVAILGTDGVPALNELVTAGAAEADGGDRYRLKAALRTAAIARYRQAHGEPAYREWAAALASRCSELKDWSGAVEALLEAGQSVATAQMILQHQAELLAGTTGADLVDWCERVARDGAASAALWRVAGQAAEQSGQEERAVDLYGRAWEATAKSDLPEERARTAEALATLHKRRGQADLARFYLQEGFAALGDSTAAPAELSSAGALRAALSLRPPQSLESSAVWRQLQTPLGLLLSAGGAYLIWLAAPALGLSLVSSKLMSILAGAAVLWGLKILPEFAVGLTACVVALLWGATSQQDALAGFTGASFYLLVVIAALGSLVAKSGLTFRAALLGMKFFPATYRGQMASLSVTGLLVTPLISSVSGRMSMVGPLVLALKDNLRLPNRSKGSAGLAMAAWLGFGQLSFLFFNGGSQSLLAYGLLPPATRGQLSWGTWFLAALPLGVVVFLGCFAAILWLFRPGPVPPVDRQTLASQTATLGRMDYQEMLGLLALFALLLTFASEPWHHVNPGWIGLLLVTALFLLGADRNLLRTLDWNYLLYYGAFFSLSQMMTASGTGTALGHILAPVLAPLAASPYLFLGGLAMLAFVLRTLASSLPTVPMLMFATVPLAPQLGYSPLVFALALLVGAYPWILPSIDTGFDGLYVGTEERVFTLAQIRPLAWFHAAVIVVAVCCAIPFWRLMGLLP